MTIGSKDTEIALAANKIARNSFWAMVACALATAACVAVGYLGYGAAASQASVAKTTLTMSIADKFSKVKCDISEVRGYHGDKRNRLDNEKITLAAGSTADNLETIAFMVNNMDYDESIFSAWKKLFSDSAIEVEDYIMARKATAESDQERIELYSGIKQVCERFELKCAKAMTWGREVSVANRDNF